MGCGCLCVARSPLSGLIPTLPHHLTPDAPFAFALIYHGSSTSRTLASSFLCMARTRLLLSKIAAPASCASSSSVFSLWQLSSSVGYTFYLLIIPCGLTRVTRTHVPERGWLIFASLLYVSNADSYVQHRVGLQMVFESVMFLSK